MFLKKLIKTLLLIFFGKYFNLIVFFDEFNTSNNTGRHENPLCKNNS